MKHKQSQNTYLENSMKESIQLNVRSSESC